MNTLLLQPENYDDEKLLYFVLLGTLLSACSNDFEVAAPGKKYPLLMDLFPQRHSITSASKNFSTRMSVLEIAQIADSLYYNENAISVWLENTGTQARVPLYRVDGNLEGYVRDSGLFADRPNWLYRTSGPFVTAGKTYELVIERNDGKPDITAQTVVPGDFVYWQNRKTLFGKWSSRTQPPPPWNGAQT